MYSLTSRCFCSCLSCLPYSERARVRCLGLHSRNPAVEHFQERQWIQPPWNIALEIKFGLTIYNIHINIYSILYMVQFFFLGKNHPPDIPHHLIPLAVQCCLTPELFIYYWKSNVSLICCNILRCFSHQNFCFGVMKLAWKIWASPEQHFQTVKISSHSIFSSADKLYRSSFGAFDMVD